MKRPLMYRLLQQFNRLKDSIDDSGRLKGDLIVVSRDELEKLEELFKEPTE